MPYYDYYCKNCGNEQEHFVKIEHIDENTTILCDVCNHVMDRKFTAVSFNFSNTAMKKHINKYGKESSNAPTTRDNGVKFYKKPKNR